MTQYIKRYKKRMIFILCIFGLFLGVMTARLTVTAANKATYLIKVNKQQNCVTVYEKDEEGEYTVPIKAMTCSTGSATPVGTYSTLAKYRWKLLMGNVWGQYSTRIIEGILFHSVWYYEMDETTLSTTQYNKLGTTASHGCVRLTVADAKWIYDNCLIGTTVEIYNDKDPGPLGKPEAVQLQTGLGWDPTDPSNSNPYKDLTPTIKGAANKTITWGAKVNLLKGVKASSTTGTDITSEVVVDGDVDIYKAGDYKIKYKVTDALGRTKKKTITITVAECKAKPKFEGIADRSVSRDIVVDKKFALKGVKAYLSTLKLDQKDIEVTIDSSIEDVYSIEYKITADNNLTATETASVYVDTKAPVFKGLTHRAITLEELESGKSGIKKLALKNVTVKDDYSVINTKKVNVSVKVKSDYAYLVTYIAEDEVGNMTCETVQFTYYSSTSIQGVSNHFNLPYGTEITESFVLQGVSASNSEGDCTNAITVAIENYGGNVYTVTYSVLNEEEKLISVVSYYIVDEKSDDVDETITDGETTDGESTDATTDGATTEGDTVDQATDGTITQ